MGDSHSKRKLGRPGREIKDEVSKRKGKARDESRRHERARGDNPVAHSASPMRKNGSSNKVKRIRERE